MIMQFFGETINRVSTDFQITSYNQITSYKNGACDEISSREKIVKKPQLSLLALISFIVSFAVARTFSALRPTTVMIVGKGLHVHHFWFGIALLAIGGWLGISYDNERINRLAAILFGAGGGLIGDEIGLLLTFKSYWTELTYTFVITFLAIASILILMVRYSRTVGREFAEFFRSNASLYVGVFLEAVSIAFFMETDDITIKITAVALAVFAFTIVVAYFVQRIRMKR